MPDISIKNRNECYFRGIDETATIGKEENVSRSQEKEKGEKENVKRPHIFVFYQQQQQQQQC